MTPISGNYVARRHAPFAHGLEARDGAPRPFQWGGTSSDATQVAEDASEPTPATREMAEPSLVGSELEGAYRITRLIAMGGMSTVYEAVQLRLNQRVAVKVMARELAANEEALARFQREAEVTSRLRHPHLVTVTDFGTVPGGEPFLVMEYLDGIDLDQRIRRHGPLPLSAVVAITKQAAAALGAAHDSGIVHRDLKPANVFLVELPGEPEFVKILDFGVSKVRAASSQLTRASFIIGTPYYMSPEQATGMIDEIDPRTDQWALACIAWELLSGRVPFAGDDMSAVFYQIIHLDPAPLAPRVPGLPPAVEAVLRRALAKHAAHRFPSIREFASALEAAAGDQSAAQSADTANAELAADAPALEPDRPAVLGALWRELGREPIYAIAAVCAAVLLVVLLWSSRLATPAPPPPPPSSPTVAVPAPSPTVAVPAPSPTVAVPVPSPEPRMSVAPAPVPEAVKPPAATTPGAGTAAKAAVAPAKLRAAPAKAPAAEPAEGEPADPFQPPTAVEDPADPFAPPAAAPAPAPQVKAAPARAADPADPFAP